MPIVLVELPVADASNANAPALIAACSAGLHSGQCLTEEGSNERATAVAIVVWLDADRLHARIELGRRDAQRAGWQARDLTFHEQDAQGERWRSVGLAIAGMVGEAMAPQSANVGPIVSASRKPPPKRTALLHDSFRVALGPTIESGLRGGAPSAGAWLDLGGSCCGGLPLEITVHAANTWSLQESQGVAMRFFNVGLGVSGSLRPASALVLRASLLAALEAVTASATNPANGARASGARWVYGWLGRVQAVWPANRPLSGVIGLELMGLSGATQVKTFERDVGVSPSVREGIQLGLEWKF